MAKSMGKKGTICGPNMVAAERYFHDALCMLLQTV
jgi:hypothetical protein